MRLKPSGGSAGEIGQTSFGEVTVGLRIKELPTVLAAAFGGVHGNIGPTNTAQPGDHIEGSGGGEKAVGDLSKDLVAGVVPTAVLDDLEVIEIDEPDPHRLTAGALERVLEPLEEPGAVEEPGEVVVVSLRGEMLMACVDLERFRENGARVTSPDRECDRRQCGRSPRRVGWRKSPWSSRRRRPARCESAPATPAGSRPDARR
jgi:hypothetical protein